MKKTTITLSFIFISFFIMGQNNPADLVKYFSVEDLNFEVFNDTKHQSFYNKTYDTKVFESSFYLPWNYVKVTDNASKDEIWDDFFSYEKGIASRSGCYTGNYQGYTENLIKAINENIACDKATFLDVIDYGITTQTTDIRRLPTDEFCLKRIRNAGEGYPFDELQYTTIWVGTPIVILSKSEDNIWCFVQSTYSKGWVKTAHIALVDKQQRDLIMNAPKVVITSDDVIVNTKSLPLKLNLGTLLPSLPNSNEILIPVRSYLDGKLFFDTVKVNSIHIKKFPIAFNAENVKSILSELIGGKYSWGGLDNGRDCSSTLKDYFTVFGIWTPRNSRAQSNSGEKTNLAGLSDPSKLKTIKDKGLPFLSTIYKRGHIMLYVQNKNDGHPLIFHATWGMKAFYKDKNLAEISDHRSEFGIFGIHKRDFFHDEVQTRFIIGKSVITSIEPIDVFDHMEKIRMKRFVENYLTLTNIAKK